VLELLDLGPSSEWNRDDEDYDHELSGSDVVSQCWPVWAGLAQCQVILRRISKHGGPLYPFNQIVYLYHIGYGSKWFVVYPDCPFLAEVRQYASTIIIRASNAAKPLIMLLRDSIFWGRTWHGYNCTLTLSALLYHTRYMYQW